MKIITRMGCWKETNLFHNTLRTATDSKSNSYSYLRGRFKRQNMLTLERNSIHRTRVPACFVTLQTDEESLTKIGVCACVCMHVRNTHTHTHTVWQ